MEPLALELKQVGLRYASSGATALRNASLHVRAGELVVVEAGAEAGMTSLLHCAAGLVGPDTGKVRWFGSHRWSAARAAYAPARADSHPYLAVRPWLEFAAAQRDDESSADDSGVGIVMRRAALDEFARIRVGHLTPGVSARVALAGALLADPRVLLLDRPFDGLSGVERARFAQVLGFLRADAIAIVVGTRDATACAPAAPDRVVRMVGGTVTGTVDLRETIELDVSMPIEARSRLALRVPSVYRRGRTLRVPLQRWTSEQVLSECRALGIEVHGSRIIPEDAPSRRRGALAPLAPLAPRVAENGFDRTAKVVGG
ncbi:MAG: ATP-binding cassette domain-containing protein [Gemmatimonadetes bacterium]|nr:ATP-binding cassette domain-containing protein [Gemmatimonadota bacterium]